MISKEIVKRAVTRTGPPRMPLLYFNEFIEKSDIIRTSYGSAKNFVPDDPNRSEWGFRWERLDDTMGQPTNPPIADWDMLTQYRPPDANAPGRFDHMADFVRRNNTKYLIGELGISGLNLVTFLRGFAETMEDLYLEPERMMALIHMVYDFEIGIIEGFCRYDIDAVSFSDDLGTQQSLMLAPDMWRKVFKPLYKKQFDIVHSHGKDVYFHSCGYVYPIIQDLIDIGVDVFNFNQPDLLGIDHLNRDFGGKVSFACPVDHQTVAITGTREEIFGYVRHLKDTLGAHNGGLIGYIEEYSSVGMKPESFASICEAFETIGSEQ